ncbi:MAG: hypothetical protein B6I19_07955 [Bacteroidetes bacterium 4572_114]|nr:MAG: hypothetical protein B6I19_07955 [Bacteroidetes bacterium 4572_114]
MKKLSLFIAVLFVTLVSCNKTQDSNAFDSKTQKDAPIEKSYHYECTGECDNGSTCGLYWNVPGNYAECTCEGCILVVTVTDGIGEGEAYKETQKELLGKLNAKELFFEHLNSFVFRKYKTNEFKLISIELIEYENDYCLLYDFVTSDGISESVMYACVNEGKEDPVTYEIDCSGTCNEPNETCRERFNFNPPSAECTCAGDGCKMTIIEL